MKVAEVKLSYTTKVKASERVKVVSSSDAEKVLRESWEYMEYVESFKVLLLNRSNRVLGVATISKGGVSATVVDPKVLFQYALKTNASAIILAHNHPSGELKPSTTDDKLTDKLKKGGELLDVNVLDHVIITEEGYYSYADNGKI